jgi:hypothetical protein
VYIDFLCLKCGKKFELPASELVICPGCGSWRSHRDDPGRELIPVTYWQGTRHERFELGFCYRHEALVPKTGGCPQCKIENVPQFFRKDRFDLKLKPFIHKPFVPDPVV